MKKIGILGPHDRFNYGDLLFPIMIKKAIEKKRGISFYEIKNYSLVKANLTNKGGVESENYRKLYRDTDNSEIDALIVAGGESLRTNWNGLYSFINPFYFRIFRHPRIPPFFKKDIFIQKILGGRGKNPFMINRNLFKTKFKIIYNSVGGGQNLSAEKLNIVLNSDYLSFRENNSFDYIKTRTDKKVFLVPDCAIVMSDFYKKKSFQNSMKIRKEIREMLCNNYIFFQVSKYKNDNKLDEAIQQLNKISNQFNLKIILCPIGTAKGHEDQFPLKYIYSKVNKDYYYYINSPNVEEIMSLIAYSSLYVGTSLHGIITSMSYGVPYIGLTTSQKKLIYYLNSWGIKELNKVLNVENFIKTAEYCLNKGKELSKKILIQTSHQKEEYYKSVVRFLNIIDNE